MILLCAAIAKELDWWEERPNVETLLTGVGPVEAGCRVAHALTRQRYRLVVNVGVAGAFAGAAKVGDGVVVRDEFVELDLENGKPLQLPDGEQVVDHTASDTMLTQRMRELGFATLHGVTVGRVTAGEATAQRLAATGAQVESMEGFAVLRAAELTGVPAIELRGISNRVGERSQSGWDLNAGFAGLQRVTRALFALIDAAEAHASRR